MACRGCTSRRSSNPSATFSRTGPTATLGDKSKTFGMRLIEQPRRGTKTIQTSPADRNNIHVPEPCASESAPPPCPCPPRELLCAPPGFSKQQIASFCSDFEPNNAAPFVEVAGPFGSTFSFAGGHATLKAFGDAGSANFTQIVGAYSFVNPSTSPFCICFDAHSTYFDALRQWEGGLMAVAPGAVGPSILVIGDPATSSFKVRFVAAATFTSAAYTVASLAGTHIVRLCHAVESDIADPRAFSLQIDNGAIQNFTVPANTVPNVLLPVSLVVLTAPSVFSETADFDTVCAQKAA